MKMMPNCRDFKYIFVKFYIGWGGERSILYKGVETSPSKRVLKILRESPRKTIYVSSGLDCYKWYQSLTPGDVPARRMSPKGGGHETVCQRGWIGGVPH